MRTLPIHTCLVWAGARGEVLRTPAVTRADRSPLCLGAKRPLSPGSSLPSASLTSPLREAALQGSLRGCVLSLQVPRVSCGRVAALGNLGCFWGTAWVKCQELLSPPLRGSSRDWSPSAGWGQLFSLALLDPDQWFTVMGSERGWSIRSCWAGACCKRVLGSPVAALPWGQLVCVYTSHGQGSVFFGLCTCFGGPPLQPPNGACLFLKTPVSGLVVQASVSSPPGWVPPLQTPFSSNPCQSRRSELDLFSSLPNQLNVYLIALVIQESSSWFPVRIFPHV